MSIEEVEQILKFLDFNIYSDDPEEYPNGYYMSSYTDENEPMIGDMFTNGHPTENFFQDDWRFLMYLVEKIETLETEFDGRFTVSIRGNECIIWSSKFDSRPETAHYSYFMTETLPTKIESVYYCVKCFCHWYNQNHKK